MRICAVEYELAMTKHELALAKKLILRRVNYEMRIEERPDYYAYKLETLYKLYAALVRSDKTHFSANDLYALIEACREPDGCCHRVTLDGDELEIYNAMMAQFRKYEELDYNLLCLRQD